MCIRLVCACVCAYQRYAHLKENSSNYLCLFFVCCSCVFLLRACTHSTHTQIWNLRTGELQREVPLPAGSLIYSCLLSPDRTLMLVHVSTQVCVCPSLYQQKGRGESSTRCMDQLYVSRTPHLPKGSGLVAARRAAAIRQC